MASRSYHVYIYIRVILVIYICFAFTIQSIKGLPTLLITGRSAFDNSKHSLNFTELTAENGYISEEHTAETEDGYLLKIFRIVKGNNCKGPKKQPPVILMHGLLESSDLWLGAGPKASLAYLIADACYDIWVGNQRGNYYSRHHKYLNPDKDPNFWKFSVDEIGLYDIPATIDYVLNYTGAAKVNYIGFSQGCGTFYIMCSERPGYCDKAQLKISLAPATRHLNTKSIGFRKVNLLFENLQDVLDSSGVYEALPKGGTIQELAQTLCQSEGSYSVCLDILTLFDAYHPGSIKNETLRLLYEHFPAGTSVRNLARYGQSMRSQDFVKYDHGVENNVKLYGSARPPVYNFRAVTAPVVVIYGNNDGVVDKEDVKWLVGKLPNVVEAYEVKDPLWTHVDMAYSQDVNKYVFTKISEYLRKYSYYK